MPAHMNLVCVPHRVLVWSRMAAMARTSAVALVASALAWAGVAQAQVQSFPDIAGLVEKVAPAVVHVSTGERGAEGRRAPAKRAPQGSHSAGDELASGRAEGAGFVFSADGLVITSAQVVAGASEVHVSLGDKREFKARVVGFDDRSDIAVLKVDAVGLPALRLADLATLRAGEWVAAVGPSQGAGATVTTGIVSAKPRDVGFHVPLLQAQLPAHPGHAGAPIVNLRGEVVAVSSFVHSAAGASAGVSWAIPSDVALPVIEQLKSAGRVVRGYLGILPMEVPREVAEDPALLKLKGRGAYVGQVVKGSPAEKAGLRAGDVVLSLNGKPVEGPGELRRALAMMKPGVGVTCQVAREGKTVELKATLTEPHAPTASAPVGDRTETDPKGAAPAKSWGLTVASLSDAERQSVRGAGGVKVIAVQGPAEAAGVRAGDVVTALAGTDVSDVKQFEATLARADKTKSLSLTLLRGEWSQFIRVPPPR